MFTGGTTEMVCSNNTAETTWGLLGLDPGDSILEVVLHKDRFVVGRNADTDLRLYSDRVSNCHAEMLVGDGVLHVRDLDSSNGTFVNGERITGMKLVADDDRIQFGDKEFVLKLNQSV